MSDNYNYTDFPCKKPEQGEINQEIPYLVDDLLFFPCSKNFKTQLWDKTFNKYDKLKIGSAIFKKVFLLWLECRKLKHDPIFIVNKHYFDDEDSWQKYKERVKSRTFFKDFELDAGYLEFNDKLKKKFNKNFNVFFNDFIKRNKTIERDVTSVKDFEEGEDVDSFYTIQDFKKEYPNFLDDMYNDKKYDFHYIPKINITDKDFLELVLKFSPNPPKIINNPIISDNIFNYDDFNNVKKIKLRVRKLIKIKDNIKVVGSYYYLCPGCGVRVEKRPFEMSEISIKHINCSATAMEDGSMGNTKISTKIYFPDNTLTLYCYEVFLYDENDEIEKNPRYFFSFLKNIKPGEYITNSVILKERLTDSNDKDEKTIILSFENNNPKILNNLFDEEKAEQIRKDFGLKHRHNLINVLSMIKNYYNNERNISFNHRKGALMSLFCTFSSICRVIFNVRNFPIMNIGDTSVSKTYPTKLICNLLDYEYKFTSGTKTMTFPGLLGGINNETYIGNTKYRIFQDGLVAYGMVLLDEASNFLTEPEFNEVLKSISNDSLEIFKIGGGAVIMKFVPIIISNLTKHHKGEGLKRSNSIDTSYEGTVRFFYYLFVKKKESSSYHGLTKNECYDYTMKKDLYRPLQEYDNEDLRQAIARTRMLFESNDISWRTGGSIPAQNRFLFDCIVIDKYGEEKRKNDDPFDEDFMENREKNDEVNNLPKQDMINTIKEFCNIDIDFMKTKEYQDIHNKLKHDVKLFLKNDEHIRYHLMDNKGKIDDKLVEASVLFFVLLQTMNNTKSECLDESTKELGKNIILKVKRGINVDEYNFRDNSYRPDKKFILDKRFNFLDSQSEMMFDEYIQDTVDKKAFLSISKTLREKKEENNNSGQNLFNLKDKLDSGEITLKDINKEMDKSIKEENRDLGD